MKSERLTKNGCGQSTGGGPCTTELTARAVCGPWIVEVVCENGESQHLELGRGERIVIGSHHDCDLRIADPCVSGRHCALDATNQELLLVDLGSKNGVRLANARIESAKITAESTTFAIGKSRITVRCCVCKHGDRRTEPCDGLEGESEPMFRLKRDIRRLAKLRAPVLIVGESGVGKDVVARALHNLSERAGAYVPLNVATIPENLADSELFGHRKGAFTGAVSGRIGAFERAHQGTLFLDEIAELAPSVQAKLLRVLEDSMVRPIGAVEERRVDVRVVSATWTSLSEKSAVGRFRFDLFQRLSVVIVDVPPLRERRSDIPILANFWLQRYRAEMGPRHLSASAIERLCLHDWPGNVRELGSAIYRACVMSDGDIIDADAIGRALLAQGVKYRRGERNPQELLLQAGGNVSEAARLAGLPRTTFRTWLGRSKRCGAEKTGR